MTISRKAKLAGAAGVLLLAGFGSGAAVMVVGSASADETTTADDDSRGGPGGRHGGPGDGAAGEEPLTGDVLAEVTAAVEADYPGATIERAETDSDGVYEAHLTTADGERLTVELDDSYAITGTEEH